jgi:hypothetical protein
VIESLALASVCGAAVFFMLIFLRALLREARPPARFTETLLIARQEKINAIPLLIKPDSRQFDRVA